MANLKYNIRNILKRNQDGSHSTQANRKRMLMMIADDLKQLGYKDLNNPHDLKGRHINALLRKWRADEVSTGTLKNRMSNIRWLAEKVGKSEIVKSNETYGIENRKYVTNVDKSINVTQEQLDKLSPHIKQSVELQKAFGLRREEAMKFQPSYALQGFNPHTATEIKIKPSWAKGGRERIIPITNDAQRNTLINALNLVGDGSLIPSDKTYKEHLGRFERETSSIGLGQTHGLRHLYAQTRYKELMGIDCPAVGGVIDLTDEQKAKDLEVRKLISEELGHSRTSITGVYLGSWTK